MVQSSRNDKLAHELIESDIKSKDATYEIPVPFRSEKLQPLPNKIYENALIEPRHCVKSLCVILCYSKHLLTPFLS